MDKKKNKSAFSFAEIMISLVVIGVISMLVIPNLLDNSTNRTTNTSAQKARYDISQASMRLQTECPRFRCNNLNDTLRDLLPDNGDTQYLISDRYTARINGNDEDVIEVLVNIDGAGDTGTDLSVMVTSTGGIIDTPRCSLNDYVSGTGCSAPDITNFNQPSRKDRNNVPVNFH